MSDFFLTLSVPTAHVRVDTMLSTMSQKVCYLKIGYPEVFVNPKYVNWKFVNRKLVTIEPPTPE